MSFNFIFSHGKIAKESYLNATIYQYSQICYGLKYYLWSNRDKKAIFSYYKNNGLLSQFQYTTVNRRNKEGNYTYDGSEMNWDAYNKSTWKEFKDDFEEKTKLPQSVSTIKEVIEHKNKLLIYFLENHAQTIKLEFKAEPLMRKKPLVTEDGIKIILLEHNHQITQFEIKSPSNTISLIINIPKDKKGYSELINHHQNEQILFPKHAHELMKKFFEYAEIIFNNPLEVINNPHYTLNLDCNINVKLQSAQEFLIKQNQLLFEKRRNNQNYYSNQEKPLVHENFEKSQDSPVTKLNQTIKELDKVTESVEKNNTVDFEKNQPTYNDTNHKFNSELDIWLYEVDTFKFINWLKDDNELLNWIEDERIFILYDNNLEIISDLNLDDENLQIWTQSGIFLDSKILIYIEEPDYQIFKSLAK